MNRFHKYLLAAVVMTATVACAITPDVDDTPSEDSGVVFSLNFSTTPTQGYEHSMGRSTRNAWDEIQDVNVYIWNDTEYYHCYTSDKTIALPLVKGQYNLRIIANRGVDMDEDIGSGRKVIDLVENYKLSYKWWDGVIYAGMLSAAETLTVNSSTTHNIALTRIDAKIDINLQVDPGFATDFNLLHVALWDTPNGCNAYPARETNTPNCTQSQLHADAPDNQYSFYCCENIKPSNPAIKSQQEKNKNSAPEGASYILITGEQLSTGKLIEYRVYCGRNMTTDFTLPRNTVIKYNITILNANATDVRIEDFAVSYNGLLQEYIPYYGPTTNHTIPLGDFYIHGAVEANRPLSYDISFSSTAPFLDYYEVYHEELGEWRDIGLPDLLFSYTPTKPTKVKLRAHMYGFAPLASLCDSFYYQMVCSKEIFYSNYETHIDQFTTEPITKKLGLHHSIHIDPAIGDPSFIETFSPAGGTTEGRNLTDTTCLLFNIHQNSGCSFQGNSIYKYSPEDIGVYDQSGNELAITGDTYSFTVCPQYSSEIHIKPREEIEITHLSGASDASKSNCYLIDRMIITNSDGGYYSFDATTKGNGVGFVDGVNILPALGVSVKIAPTKLKCLWGDLPGLRLENGQAIFYVPRLADYNNLPQTGSALVAACDDSDNVLWSWHIIIYSGDGTLRPEMFFNSTGYDSQSIWIEGQYQWGRKDPYLHGASTTISSTQGLAISISYPTRFSTLDNWLSGGTDAPKKDLLWGGSKKIKTLYDPCPPGYKVGEGGALSIGVGEEVILVSTYSSPTKRVYYYKNFHNNATQDYVTYLNSFYWTTSLNSNGSINTYSYTPYPNSKPTDILPAYSTSTSSKRSGLGRVRCERE